MKRNELKQKYHKETLCYYKDQSSLINKDYMNWLEDEIIKQLTLTDVSQQRELLKAYAELIQKDYTHHFFDDAVEESIDQFLSL